MSALHYLEHLTDSDLSLLVSITDRATDVEALLTYLPANPHYLDALLRHPALYARLFGPGEEDALLQASPFLAFAVLLGRAVGDLTEASFVQEWVGPGRRVPMFQVRELQEFATDAERRLFLAELLASYTHVGSGSMWVQTARGWRRRRFSELDPLRLLELLQMLPERERPALYRRLGDLALFLTGVFPDYAGTRLLPTLKRQRIERTLRWTELGARDEASGTMPGDIGLLEHLGRQSYLLAGRATEPEHGGLLADVAEGFGQARRVLNFLTDRYLFPRRDQWFPMAGSS